MKRSACELRQEAIRRRLEGERRCDICRDLGRSLRWFDKWWGRYQAAPGSTLSDGSRAPHTSPHKTPPKVERAVLRVRRTFEAGRSAHAPFGLIGHRAIHGELQRLKVSPVPSLPTIQRILQRHELTRRPTTEQQTAYYPTLLIRAPNTVHATDIITRHLRGGAVVQNFHTIDLYTHAVHLSQFENKTSASACQHLLETWADVGLPRLLQMDNEDSFRGGHTHRRVIGRVVRLCLFVGVEPLFIPFYEAKRNGWVEGFHALWVKAFWSKEQFADLARVRQRVGRFLRWYSERYRPPSLDGKTPSQMLDGVRPVLLTDALRDLIPDPLPVTAGFIHLIRKVDTDGKIVLLNQPWTVGRRWSGTYVWARVYTARQQLSVCHKADAACTLIKTSRFWLGTKVHPLLPSFRRKRARCPEHWPG